MGIPFINKKKTNKNLENEEELFLTLDIGTEYVKTAVYKVENEIAYIVGFSREQQHSNAMEGAMIINIKDVISACDIGIGKALAVADKIIGKKCTFPENVTMGISGELVKGISIIAEYEREKPDTPITNEELQSVIEGVKEQAFSDSILEISEEIGSSPKNIKEIGSHINSTYIDGVKVDDPTGFTGQAVSYKVYSTFAPSIHINSLYEIAKQLELNVVTIDIQPYAISKSFKGAGRSDFSSVFVDIGGGTTDIAIVQNGGIVGTKMYAFGGRVFTRRIAKSMNIEIQNAEEMKLDYSRRKLQTTTEKKIKEYIQDDITLWAEGLEIALAEFNEIDIYPDEFLISGGGAEMGDIYDTLISYPWLQVLPFEKFPKIKHIYPSQIANVKDETGLMISGADVACAALTSISLDFIK